MVDEWGAVVDYGLNLLVTSKLFLPTTKVYAFGEFLRWVNVEDCFDFGPHGGNVGFAPGHFKVINVD